MKKKPCFILVALCFLLALTACQKDAGPAPAEPAPEVPEPLPATDVPEDTTPEVGPLLGVELTDELSERERDWIEDIEYLRTEYKTQHMDPFYLCSEEEFDWKLDQLKAKVDELSDTDIFFELCAVLAGMGDGHTSIYPSESLAEQINSRVLPVKIRYFGGHYYLWAYRKGDEQFAPYLLREIVAVNGIDITYLEGKMAQAYDPFNRWWALEYLAQYLTSPSFLDWAGCDYAEGYTLQLLDENQEVQSVEAPVVTTSEALEAEWIHSEGWDRLFCGTSGDWAEYIEGENGGCVCIHYTHLDGVMAIIILFEEAEDLFEAHPECSKLVIDLRSNHGGNGNRIAQIRTCAEEIAELPIEQTYVAVGGQSASGAIECITIFQDVLDAVVVGEPTGQFYSFFYLHGTAADFTLPHSQLWGKISDGWFETEAAVEQYYDEDGKLYPWENTVLPDVYISQDIEDIRQGKDSVIEWVLRQ